MKGITKYLPIVVCVFGAIAFQFYDAWPTLDGAAHVHTAKLLLNNAIGNGPLGEIYCSTGRVATNSLGHYILAFLQLFLSADRSELVLVSIIFFVLGYSMVRVIRANNAGGVLVAFVCFPFIYNHLLLLGFYNFMLGTALCIWGYSIFIRMDTQHKNSLISLSAVAILIALSHVFSLCFFLLLCGCHLITSAISEPDIRIGIRKTVPVIISLVPATILLIVFGAAQNPVWSVSTPLINFHQFFNLELLELFGRKPEAHFISMSAILLFGSALIALGLFGQKQALRTTGNRSLLFALGICLLLYFFTPDSTGAAGFITMRLQFFVAILMVLFAGSILRSKWLVLPIATIALLTHVTRTTHAAKISSSFHEPFHQMEIAGDMIESNSVVLPVNFHNNWLMGHAASKFGLYTDAEILDNYECGLGYFPLEWCGALPAYLTTYLNTNPNDRTYLWLPDHVKSGKPPVIDHIILFGMDVDSSNVRNQPLFSVLQKHYKANRSSEYVTVFDLVDH
jgi:hypothetical protein